VSSYRGAVGPITYPSLVVYTMAILGDEFSIRLHVTLLEVISKLPEVLIVRKQGVRL